MRQVLNGLFLHLLNSLFRCISLVQEHTLLEQDQVVVIHAMRDIIHLQDRPPVPNACQEHIQDQVLEVVHNVQVVNIHQKEVQNVHHVLQDIIQMQVHRVVQNVHLENIHQLLDHPVVQLVEKENIQQKGQLDVQHVQLVHFPLKEVKVAQIVQQDIIQLLVLEVVQNVQMEHT